MLKAVHYSKGQVLKEVYHSKTSNVKCSSL